MKYLIQSTNLSSVLYMNKAPGTEKNVDPNISDDIQRTIGAKSLVRVTVNGSIFTLTGFAADSYTLLKAAQRARELGAKAVINRLLLLH